MSNCLPLAIVLFTVIVFLIDLLLVPADSLSFLYLVPITLITRRYPNFWVSATAGTVAAVLFCVEAVWNGREDVVTAVDVIWRIIAGIGIGCLLYSVFRGQRAETRCGNAIADYHCTLEEAIKERATLRETLEQLTSFASLAPRGTWSVNAGLTKREQNVLDMVKHGITNKEIAVALQITESTVKNDVRSARSKMGARNRAELAAMAMRSGPPPPDDDHILPTIN